MSEPTTLEPVSTVSVAVTVASAQSAAIGSAGEAVVIAVRLLANVQTCVVFGDNPAATTGAMELLAGVPEYFDLKPGQKVAAIRAPDETVDGTLKITRMNKRSAF